MIQYATLDQLGRRGRSLLQRDGRVLAKAVQASVRGSTFLSHSSKDAAEHVSGAMSVLEDHGAVVYLDKKDPSLPPHTTHETAEALKARIKLCECFVLFATRQSSGSRWVPWELGLSDGFKTTRHVAVFPGADNVENTSWVQEEYLGVYDRVGYGDMTGRQGKVWMVLNSSSSTARELSDWLGNR